MIRPPFSPSVSPIMPNIKDQLFALSQHLLPQHGLSRLSGKLMESGNQYLKNTLIRWFVNRYQVDMTDAQETDPLAYPSFNDFFTRTLKPEARPIASDDQAIICPADGALSQFGAISAGQIIQAKGHHYSTAALLGDEQRAQAFQQGQFATVYLSPRDYHRLHMPMRGTLQEMVYIPGKLFSVNQATTAVIANLFARNERVVAFYETDIGPMALVLVGAIFVASIETTWHGLVTPPAGKAIQRWQYQQENKVMQRGEEMGRFKLGSTIVMLFGNDCIDWVDTLHPGSPVKMGQSVGKVKDKPR